VSTGPATTIEDEWLFGWDSTPAIVSVWADADGRAHVWRRTPAGLVRDDLRFRPWVLLGSLADLTHLGPALVPDAPDAPPEAITWRALEGPGALRFVVSAPSARALSAAVLYGHARRTGHTFQRLNELDERSVLVLPPEEQYLVATGRTYFRDLAFDDLHRLQFDLETTGLDPARSRVFLVAVSDNRGLATTLEARGDTDADEAELLRALVALVRATDPDVIENHNLHGFDLPFLAHRAKVLRVPLVLGRLDGVALRPRPGPRGRTRYVAPGRELIDTLDAVRRHDFSARDLPGHGLKAVARHFGLAGPEREYVPGAEIYATYLRDPERVRRYALDDVAEAAGLARLLGGAAFALARMAPRRYERLADAGPATGVLDPLLVRAYLRAGAALPARSDGDGTVHTGAALYLFACGVAHRVVKADVASLYPSLMREYRIGPRGDRLHALLALVDRLVDQRLAAKARGRAAPPGSPERYTAEALSAAMKILVNSAYGYLGAVGLTRFADVHAANEVTRRGREVLDQICRALAARGVTLLEGDTDGVYFAVPAQWTEDDERRVVREVGALLPAQVRLEFDGRYAAMLSHEPKNYALLGYDGALTLRGVAFRSSRAEPFGERFLREAAGRLLAGDVRGVQSAYHAMARALRRRELATADVTNRVRLTKTPAQYLATRDRRKELPYEAMLTHGRATWAVGERVRVYRAMGKRAGLWAEDADGHRAGSEGDPRDYDGEHYARVLRESYAARLARAFSAEGFRALFDDPDQPSLFARLDDLARPRLTVVHSLGEAPSAPDAMDVASTPRTERGQA
jgi:DNA polymerase elongation subunit (family B)